MAAGMRCAACVALACCWLAAVCAYNLEPRMPVVKLGSPRSHFGYSVAQHKSFAATPTGIPTQKSWILVGAPKDHNLQPGTDRSGALWKCPLTTNTSDCVQVQTDGFRDPEKRLYKFDNSNNRLSEPAEDEIKDGQWLGVTLKSQGPGGKVLVCAHRYMNKGPDFQWGFGLCYILSNNLDVLEELEPCKGKPVDSGHLQYGFCQAGTSGILLEDEVVLGVPGPFTWRGTVHTSNTSDNYLIRDKTQYFGPVTEADSPVDKYSYLGYSVTAGRFFGNYMSYVSGAPRSEGTGQVVFFGRVKTGISLLRVDLILSGEMFASSFGYEVLALDINGDDRDDLVVGAPFYYNNRASGAIYVYMNNEGGFKENHEFTKIEGEPGETRFGSSMTSLGDLNHDGYQDIAVGAPYEGKGTIRIYLGGKDGLSTTPSQIIHAEDIPGETYDAFGYALSGGIDLDNNGYPDLLTSSFCSDRVLLLRARPIIEIKTKVESQGQLDNIDPTRKGCREDLTASETCFSFDACFKMDNDAGTRTGLMLHYTIEEEPYQDRPLPRVRFAESTPNQPSEVHREISLRPDDMGRYRCSKEIVYLMEGSHDILRALQFKLTYEIIQKEPRPVPEGAPMPNINEYPILNQKEAQKRFEGTFAKDCGYDNICKSDLHVTGSLDLEEDPSGKGYLLLLGEYDTVPLMLEVINTEEPAYMTTLYVRHNEALFFDPADSEIGIYECTRTSPGVIKCHLDNPLVNTTGPLKLNFRQSGQTFDSKYIYFKVEVNSSSTELTPEDPLIFKVEIIKRAEISINGVATPEQVFYGGEVIGESAINYMDEIGTEVIHKYVVDNRGPWRVDELQVEVLWPHQVENGKEKGKWLLYMTEHPTVDGVGECKIDPLSLINPLNLRRSKIYPDTFKGPKEVDLEVESTDDLKPTTKSPVGVVDGSGSKVTKVTTEKKVTTVVKKTTKKTSYEKDFSESSSGGTISSSSSSSSSSGSHSSSSHSGFGDDVEGSGHSDSGHSDSGHSSSRVHGRTHSRVSRRVYSSSEGSKFNEAESESDPIKEDQDGRVITHYERTHHSSGKSPDGTSTFKETHHESRKVTVNEDTHTDNIPSGRWGHGGGYRRTYTENRSSTRINDGDPVETHRRWETHETFPSGQDENQWGDSGSDRREEIYSAGRDGENRWSDSGSVDRRREESRREHSRTYSIDTSTRRTHTDQLGENNFHRTHEGGAVTQTHDGSYWTDEARRTRVQDQDGTGRDRFAWSDQRGRPSYNRGTESRNRENYYEERTHETDGITGRRGGSSHHQDPAGDGYENRGGASSSQWSRTRYEDRRSSGSQGFDEDRRSSGSQGFDEDRRSSSSQGFDDRHGRRQDSWGSEGGHDSRYASGQGYRSHQDRDRTHNEDEYTRTHHARDYGRGREEDYPGHHSESTSRRYEGSDDWQPRDHRRQGQDDSGRDESYGGSHSGSTRHRSHMETRTSTWDSHPNSGQGSRGAWDTRQDDNYERHHSGFSHLESDGPRKNGTYTRVEVDPKTGKTTTYSRKVVYKKWPSNSPSDSDQRGMEEEDYPDFSSDHRSARTKREKELIIKPQAVTDEKTGKTMQVVHLSCDSPATAKCFAFRCNIRNLAAGRTATIYIKSRLWNSTLVEDYPRVNTVSIKSRASLILPKNLREDQDQEDDTDSAETRAYPDLLDQLPPEEVPLWVILVSIFAGLLLLILIVLILWKLGFFERKRPDPTLSGNLDKDINGY